MSLDMLNINGITDYASMMETNKATQGMTSNIENAKTDEELMEACKGFENYLWEQVLKSMKSTVNVFGAEEDKGANSQIVDVFMDTAISDVAKGLTNQNIGPGSLAQQMYEQMKRNQAINPEDLINKDEESN